MHRLAGVKPARRSRICRSLPGFLIVIRRHPWLTVLPDLQAGLSIRLLNHQMDRASVILSAAYQ
jgi:hypothetical protein